MAAKHSYQVEIETEIKPEAKKCRHTVQTVKKWVLENDKILGTSMWLAFNTSALYHTIVASLNCSVCIRFERGRRNVNPAFIVGLTNLRSSSFNDHAATDMHAHAKLLYIKKPFE